MRVYYTDGTNSGYSYYVARQGDNKRRYTWTTASGKTVSYISFQYSDEGTFLFEEASLVEGTSILNPYAPYTEHTLTIPESVQSLEGYGLGNNATGFYNYIDFNDKNFIKKCVKVTYDGSTDEEWDFSTGRSYASIYVSKIGRPWSELFTNSGVGVTWLNGNSANIIQLGTGSNPLPTDIMNGTIDTFRVWLSANPISIVYEGSVFFAQNKDLEYAWNKLYYEGFNETILNPQLETNDGNIIKNTANVNMELEYNPTYNESDWLKQNRIWSIGINFSILTFMIGGFNSSPSGFDSDGNPIGLKIAKEVLFQFFSAKKLDHADYENSEQMEMILNEYFKNNE
jgi:hypothetical protein